MFTEIAQNLKDNYENKYSEDLHKLKLFIGEVKALAEQQDTKLNYMHDLVYNVTFDCDDALSILNSIDDEIEEDDGEPNCFEAEAEFCRNNFGRIFV